MNQQEYAVSPGLGLGASQLADGVNGGRPQRLLPVVATLLLQMLPL